MIYILGGQGFVGSAFVRRFERDGAEHTVITRANYESLKGTACDLFINANGNSKKFMSDRDPVWDFDASVTSVVRSLVDFDSTRYVMLSSGDVYPVQTDPSVTREDQTIDTRRLSRYGLHKYLAEEYVRATHRNHLVVRMGGFVGTGLKKNAIFDMMTGDKVWLHPDSALQFISTDTSADLVMRLVGCGARNETVNVSARGMVGIGALHQRLGSQSPFEAGTKPIAYELSTEKLERLIGAPPPSSQAEVEAFLGLA